MAMVLRYETFYLELLTANLDPDKYSHYGYGISFDMSSFDMLI